MHNTCQTWPCASEKPLTQSAASASAVPRSTGFLAKFQTRAQMPWPALLAAPAVLREQPKNCISHLYRTWQNFAQSASSSWKGSETPKERRGGDRPPLPTQNRFLNKILFSMRRASYSSMPRAVKPVILRYIFISCLNSHSGSPTENRSIQLSGAGLRCFQRAFLPGDSSRRYSWSCPSMRLLIEQQSSHVASMRPSKEWTRLRWRKAKAPGPE